MQDLSLVCTPVSPYHKHVNTMARLTESATERGRSVWEAVLEHIQRHGTVLRADVLRRFERDDAEIVRGVLRDLVDSRLLFRTGRGDATAYRVAGDEPGAASPDSAVVEHLLLVVLHRSGPMSCELIARDLAFGEATVTGLLEQLVAEGRVQRSDHEDGLRYSCDSLVIDYGDDEGWQAALFDHFQAVVSAMCTKLRIGRGAAASDQIGGSTYHFDLWPGHPLESEVLALLAETRARARALCERVLRVNAEQAPDSVRSGRRVIAYVGQTVLQDEERLDDDA